MSNTPIDSAFASNVQRRQLLKIMGMGGLGVATGLSLAHPAAAEEKGISFWASATLDIGEGWANLTKATGLTPTFTDNGNDMGPVVARLASGNANDLFDVGGFQGGAERELFKQGNIVPWDLSKIPNFEKLWPWTKSMAHLKSPDGAQLGIPSVVNADSIIYRKDKLGTVDSYGVIFDPKLKGKVAMEDAWINSTVFAAMYLKESENRPIRDPGNLSVDELGIVMEFLIKNKVDGQFRTFWNGWEQGVQLVANEEVDAMTGWEPIVYEGVKRGLDVAYAAPVEGYEGWGNNTVLLRGAVDRGLADLGHAFVNWMLDGYYGCQLAMTRGYIVPAETTKAYAAANSGEFNPEEIAQKADHVAAKFGGKVYWQNVRPDNFQLYEEWWQKLRNA
jgi:putative spermidine/putrescine transport system substrate-binding protein